MLQSKIAIDTLKLCEKNIFTRIYVRNPCVHRIRYSPK